MFGRGATGILASNSEKSGSGHGGHVAASTMDGRGHEGRVTNLPILKQEIGNKNLYHR